jgi:transposase-like protein
MDKEALAMRQVRGQQIASLEGAIRRFSDDVCYVKSQRGNGEYEVYRVPTGWNCECPDAKYRNVKCKHQWAVELSRALRETVQSRTVIEPMSYKACPICRSESIATRGVRKTRYGSIQRYACKSCGHWFVFNLGFEKMRATPQVITSAMQLYFSGESLRNTQKFLRLQGVRVSHVAIYKWIGKYVALMQTYLDQIKPNVSDVWRADELFLKVKGNMKYLYAVMDDETRFWIAQEVSSTKFTTDVRPLFSKARTSAGKLPTFLITDGAQNFHDAFNKELRTNYQDSPKHIQDIRFGGEIHNNKMERMNGEIRDREKVVRGVKREDSPLIKGLQIYHNYVRPHEALNGRTPADVAGIEIIGQNKWLTLIQNAGKQAKAQ